MSHVERSLFRLQVSVSIDIDAPPEVPWSYLTNASAFASWNSTVDAIEGDIVSGGRLAIHVPAAPERVFRPKVVRLEAPHHMTWADGRMPLFRGTRTFTVEAAGSSSRFTMTETFVGVMLPLIAGSLPDFGPIFDTYAADLKRVCEG